MKPNAQRCSEIKTWNFAEFANFLVKIKFGKKILVISLDNAESSDVNARTFDDLESFNDNQKWSRR